MAGSLQARLRADHHRRPAEVHQRAAHHRTPDRRSRRRPRGASRTRPSTYDMSSAVGHRHDRAHVNTGAVIADDAYALPERVTAGHPDLGPRFGDDVWDLRPFVPRTTRHARIDFTTLADPIAVTTAKEYLYSRLRRAVPIGHLSAPSAKLLKLTALAGEFNKLRFILATFASAGAPRLSQVTQEHLDAVLATCRGSPSWASGLVRT